jgi:hypothetical protein
MLRLKVLGSATRERPEFGHTKAGAVLRAGPVWLLHFKNASRSVPHEQWWEYSL